MPEPEEYVAMKLWGRDQAQGAYEIKKDQERAAEEDAPVDAIYKKEDGSWRRIGNLYSGHPVRRAYDRQVIAGQ